MFKFFFSLLLINNYFCLYDAVKPLDQYKEINILNRTVTSNKNLRFKPFDQYKESNVVRSNQ